MVLDSTLTFTREQMTMSKQVAYTRVSSIDQNTERQLEGLTFDKTFTDKASGKDALRPQLQAALEFLREGDTLHVHSMDRLARNVDDLRSIVKGLTSRAVVVRFHKEGLTFTGEDSPMSNLLLSMLGAVAEFERALIRERQREGIAIAKTKGIYKGRKKALTEAQVGELKVKAGQPGQSKTELAKEYGISRETLYQYIR